LENCTFNLDTIKNETFKIKEQNRLNLHNVPIGFGTHKIIKIDGKKRQIPAKLDEEVILRIKVNFIIRKNCIIKIF